MEPLAGPEKFDEDSSLGGRIAGLEPMNFITFASPHLGSRGHKQVKIDFWFLDASARC